MNTRKSGTCQLVQTAALSHACGEVRRVACSTVMFSCAGEGSARAELRAVPGAHAAAAGHGEAQGRGREAAAAAGARQRQGAA